MKRALTLLIFVLLLFVSPVATDRYRVEASAGAEAGGDAPRSEPSGTDRDEKLEEFIPSEEVPADQAISFPVDI